MQPARNGHMIAMYDNHHGTYQKVPSLTDALRGIVRHQCGLQSPDAVVVDVQRRERERLQRDGSGSGVSK